jgi:hypothetical protein
MQSIFNELLIAFALTDFFSSEIRQDHSSAGQNIGFPCDEIAVIAPSIILRPLDDAGTRSIEVNILAYGGVIAVFLNRNASIAALERMAP